MLPDIGNSRTNAKSNFQSKNSLPSAVDKNKAKRQKLPIDQEEQCKKLADRLIQNETNVYPKFRDSKGRNISKSHQNSMVNEYSSNL